MTKATSYGANIRGSDLRIVCAEHGRQEKHESATADTKIRMSVVPPARQLSYNAFRSASSVNRKNYFCFTPAP
ncbi:MULTISPECIES: hypothetical protein [Bradyrhizobium]|uniref:hypothetical protein n=1 Tax=Bradyrhizobium TaxID=374 RepID=UPI00359C19C2